jgi:hypothetical protein
VQPLARYQFLANAIAGRRVTLEVGDDTDPRTFADELSITVSSSRADEPASLALEIAAQASLIAARSLEPRVVRHLIGKPVANRRYLYLEAVRACCLLTDRLPVRLIDHADWPSAGVITGSAEQSLAVALQRQPLPPPPAFFGSLRPFRIVARALGYAGLGAPPHEEQRPGRLHAPPGTQGIPEDQATQQSKLLKLFSNPLLAGGPMGDLLMRILGGGRQPGHSDDEAAGGGAGELPVGRIERSIRRAIHSLALQGPAQPPRFEPVIPTAPDVYPEWDADRNRYRADWVLSATVAPWREGGRRNIGELFSQSWSHELRRQLASLGLSHQMHGRQFDGADLDLGPLLDSAIDLKTGHGPETPRVYRTSRRTRRDLGVVVALDMSGSTGETNTENCSQFDGQLQAAYHLGKTLDSLGDTVEVFGFHSWGRTAVRWRPVKMHDEPWSAAVTERFEQLEPEGYTRLGAAIRHAERLLRTRIRLPYRLMVLVTDGFPYDQDYEGAYAEADVRKALDEAMSAGTAVLCLCIGSSTETRKLRDVFGEACLVAVEQPWQIASRIRESCRVALARATRGSISKTHIA